VLYKYFILLVGVLLSVAAYSDIRSSVEGRVSYSESEDTYFIKISDPDGKGVSDNYFYEFSPDASKVVVLNISNNPASTIILRADRVRMQGEMSLLGVKSSILIQADYIECFSCSFDKISRLTLFTGRMFDVQFVTVRPPDMRISGMQVSDVKISNMPSGISDVSNIFTGVLSVGGSMGRENEHRGRLKMVDPHFKSVSVVELIAARPELKGQINANQKVHTLPGGGYEVSPDGGKELGETAIYMFFGGLDYDYWNSKLLRFYGSYPSYRKNTKISYSKRVSSASIDADILAAEVKITAQYRLYIKGNIKAGANVLGATQYKGKVFSPKPNLVITSVQDKVDVSGSLYSNGDLSIMSYKPLFLSDGAKVKANKKVSLISKEGVKNWGDVTANNVEVAGNGVINQGRIHAEYSVDIWSGGNVNNQFGGAILGEQVKIVANTGQVVNGSFSYYGGGLNLNAPLGNREHLDLYDGGIYTSVEPPAMGFDLESNAFANITGKRVYIDARDFFNVNPVWRDVNYSTFETGQIDLAEDPEIKLKTEYFNRVRVSAAHMLEIAVDNYLINSSAQLVVNDVSGQMKLQGSAISNERFRSLNLLSRVYLGDGLYKRRWPHGIPRELIKEAYAVLPRVYSPPGYIRSNGSLKVSGASDYFVNNFSQLWIEKNAEFGRGVRVKDVGIELGAIATGRLFYKQDILNYSIEREFFGKGRDARFIKPIAQRSVFHVGERLSGDIVKTTLKNPMSEYLADATEIYYQDVVDGGAVATSRRGYRIRCGYKTCRRYHTDVYIADEMLDSNAKELGLLGEGDLLVDTVYSVDTDLLVKGTKHKETDEVREYAVSTLDVLAHYWEQSKQAVTEFVQNLRKQLASLI